MRPVVDLAVVTVLSLLCSCSPQPRSERYFEAHPSETARELAACRRVADAGAVCRAALNAKVNARMEFHRQGF